MRLCDLTTSKTLRDLGYDGAYDDAWIDTDDGAITTEWHFVSDRHIPCPRLDDAAYWLRDRYGIYILIKYHGFSEEWSWEVFDFKKIHILSSSLFFDPFRTFRSYDTALEDGLKEALKIITNNQTK